MSTWNGLTDAERDSLCTHWKNDARQLCLDIEAVLKHKNPPPAAPEGLILMPIDPKPEHLQRAQFALMDAGWCAVTCFRARYDRLVQLAGVKP